MPYLNHWEVENKRKAEEYGLALDRLIRSKPIKGEKEEKSYKPEYEEPSRIPVEKFHWAPHEKPKTATYNYSLQRFIKSIKNILVLVIIILVIGLFLAPHTLLSFVGIDIGSYWNLDIVIKDAPKILGVVNLTKELNDKVNSIDTRTLEFKIFDGINAERIKKWITCIEME